MKTSPILLLAAAAALATATAQAAPSSPSEIRGYQNCLDANQDGHKGLLVNRQYLLAEADDQRTYYINATAWKNGERVSVGFSCDSTLSGRLISNRGASYVRFVPANDQVQVARN